MKNIFEGAKFGDKFVTREGRIVSLYKINNNFAREARHYVIMLLEPNNDMIQGFHNYNMDSTTQDNHSFLDIVSHYQESIDEEKLDELALDYRKELEELGYEFTDDEKSLIESTFKYGYLRAMMEYIWNMFKKI